MSGEVVETPHEELCDRELSLYETNGGKRAMVIHALEFYKKRGPGGGERQLINTNVNAISVLEDALDNGWTFDPWLNPSGRPITVSLGDGTGEEAYWVLVRGTPEQIAALEPFAELPEDIEEEPEIGAEPYALGADFIPYDAKGDPSRVPGRGYVIMHKDHIYAKGAVYTLPPKPVSTWALATQLAGLSGVLGVDEAHDVIAGILKRETAGLD